MKYGFGLSPAAADFAFGASIGRASASMPACSSEATCFGVATMSIGCVPLVPSAPPSDTSKPRSWSSISCDGLASMVYGASVSGAAAEAAAGAAHRPARQANSATGAREHME